MVRRNKTSFSTFLVLFFTLQSQILCLLFNLSFLFLVLFFHSPCLVFHSPESNSVLVLQSQFLVSCLVFSLSKVKLVEIESLRVDSLSPFVFDH